MPESSEFPQILLVVPTGSIKEYAFLQMLASIRNLDYPPDRLTVCICITDRGDEESRGFIERAQNLLINAKLPNDVTVLKTRFNEEEFHRWGSYVAVIKNLHEARKHFLDGSWDYLWLLGGDNPPLRDTLRRLLAVKADVASGIINQRPRRGRDGSVYVKHDIKRPDGSIAFKGGAFYGIKPDAIFPVFWLETFLPEDVRRRKDIDPRNRFAILQAWLNMTYFYLVGAQPGKVFRSVGFGSGCSLIRRTVLEGIGYYLGAGYHSEDVEFCQLSHLYGFDVALDTSTPCPHFDPNGQIY